MSALIDPFGRQVSYLRISVTDRCNYRCRYCMSENMTFLPKSDLLTLEELDRICNAFIRRGVDKIRITGGEPLVRRNIISLFRNLGHNLGDGGLKELTLTTNASQLSKHAHDLYDSGVRRINVSLDTLDAGKFETITRWGKLSDVMEGVRAAKDAGLKIKINTVALKGVNDDEMDDLIQWCGDQDFDLTFIETMPLGEVEDHREERYLPVTKLREQIMENWTLDTSQHATGGPASYDLVCETGGKLGFITPLSHNFCESCNRVRLTCEGTLYMCLGQMDKADLREPLRMSEGDDLLMEAIDKAIGQKPKGHDFAIQQEGNDGQVSRHMSVTGG